MIWFGWVLWHINHCRLFNAKSSLYIYIKYIGFGLVGFYGISNIVGYLMSIPGRVIPKTQKMVLGATLLNTQHYKVRIKGKVEQSRKWSSALPYTSV